MFWTAWHLCTILLVLSILLLAYSSVWEFSARRYLKGFSDAIIPSDSPPIEQIQAILDWMSKGPARREAGPSGAEPDRNPEDTLNYTSLLHVCGTATNAFINLADSGGLPARRLLLLDANQTTKHVVAEVRISGRWIIVDPAFRFIPRGLDSSLLTRNQLADPKIFSAATSALAGYDPSYNYNITAHVRLSRVPYLGRTINRALNAVFPGWSELPIVSLLLERDSMALLVLSAVLVAFFLIARLVLRWYAAARLGLRPIHVYRRLVKAFDGLFDITV